MRVLSKEAEARSLPLLENLTQETADWWAVKVVVGVFKNIRIRKSDPKNPKSDPKVSEIPDIRYGFGYQYSLSEISGYPVLNNPRWWTGGCEEVYILRTRYLKCFNSPARTAPIKRSTSTWKRNVLDSIMVSFAIQKGVAAQLVARSPFTSISWFKREQLLNLKTREQIWATYFFVNHM
ncbi:hypothetical protein LXL04_036967 [Taraxacum kok-saghyz]